MKEELIQFYFVNSLILLDEPVIVPESIDNIFIVVYKVS
jgi:hypothetical protein